MNRATRAGLFVVPILVSLSLIPPAAGSVYTDVVVADNPVAYWPLDETSTGDPALDLSSNHHNGAYAGSVVLATPGAYASLGTAATFDTADDEINVTGVGTDYQFPNNFTLEAWAKRRSTGGVNMILSSVGWDQRSAGPPQGCFVDEGVYQRLVVGRRCAGPTLRDFLSDDQQSHVGNDVENQKDDLEQPEERVNDHVEGFSGNGKPLALRTVHQIRGQHTHGGPEDQQASVHDGTPHEEPR